MSKKSMKEMEALYIRYNDFFFDLQSLMRQFDFMSKDVKGLCIEDRFSKYVSKMIEIMEECDKQRVMWKQKLQEQKEKLKETEEKGSRDKSTQD